MLLLRLRCHPISICVAVLVLAFVVLLLRLAWLSLHSGVLEVAALFDVLVIFARVEEAPTRNIYPYRHTPKTTRSGAIFIATSFKGFAFFGGMAR